MHFFIYNIKHDAHFQIYSYIVGYTTLFRKIVPQIIFQNVFNLKTMFYAI